MGNIALGDTIMCALYGQLLGQTTINTFVYRATGTVVGAHSREDTISALHTALNAANQLFQDHANACPDNWVSLFVRYQVIYPTRYVSIELPSAFSTGNVGTDATTPNVQASILRRGNLANKHNISRVMMPGPTSAAEQTAGLWEAGYLTLLSNVGDEIVKTRSLFTGDVVMTPIIYNRSAPQTTTPITIYGSEPTVRVMTRRTVGRGI